MLRLAIWGVLSIHAGFLLEPPIETLPETLPPQSAATERPKKEPSSSQAPAAPPQTNPEQIGNKAKIEEVEQAEQTDPSSPPTSPVEANPDPNTSSATTPSGPLIPDAERVVAQVLPNGLRVVLAHDDSLPVAAIILAVDIGTQNDPEKLPGLIHALAHHLYMGGRELAPGEAARIVHDVGGFTHLSVGSDQVRFESLVPLTSLAEVLWLESQRLHRPTTSIAWWEQSLKYASRDQASSKYKTLFQRRSEAWGAPRLASAGRYNKNRKQQKDESSKAHLSLKSINSEKLLEFLTRYYSYSRASLIVVSPNKPEDLLEQIQHLYSSRPKNRPAPSSPNIFKPSPPKAKIEVNKGIAVPIESTPHARAWADVLCRSFRYQKRIKGLETRRNPIGCRFYDDPRRAFLWFSQNKGFSITKLQQKLSALQKPETTKLVTKQRQFVAQRLEQERQSPLPLARMLAASYPFAVQSSETNTPAFELPVTRVSGEESLLNPKLPPQESKATPIVFPLSLDYDSIRQLLTTNPVEEAGLALSNKDQSE